MKALKKKAFAREWVIITLQTKANPIKNVVLHIVPRIVALISVRGMLLRKGHAGYARKHKPKQFLKIMPGFF
jgi:hypothetical protein